MSLRDRFGRLLSRLRGSAAARNPYASTVQRKIAATPAPTRGIAPQRVAAESQFAELERQIKADRERAFREAQGIEAEFAREIGGVEIPLNEQQIEAAKGWQQVLSSNVEAIRWVGGNWGCQVRFLAKKNSPSSEYEYFVGFDDFLSLKNAASKGKKIWEWRRAGIPYHRIAGGRGVETIMYPQGAVGGPKNERGQRELKIPTRSREWWAKHQEPASREKEKWYRKNYGGLVR